jgi:hypothetical protein
MIRILAAAKSPESTHESRLERVVRVHSRSEHSHRETGARVLITPNKAGKRVNVASEDGSNQFCV